MCNVQCKYIHLHGTYSRLKHNTLRDVIFFGMDITLMQKFSNLAKIQTTEDKCDKEKMGKMEIKGEGKGE